MTSSREHVVLLQRHFDPVLKMLQKCVSYCPENLWVEEHEGIPYWQQVYHAAFFVDYWLRDVYSREIEYRSMIFDKDIKVELDQQTADYLTQDELAEYLLKIRTKTDQFFNYMTDAKLLLPIKEGTEFTYTDAILSQIRHVQYHVARCNSMLKHHGLKTVEWSAYNERD